MVKKFISGLLGRKEEESKGDGASDVPDELPPLAEDVVRAAQAPKQEAKLEVSSPKSEEAPEELPPLDESLQKSAGDEGEKGTFEDLEKEDMPEEIKKAKSARIKSTELKEGSPQEDYKFSKSKEFYAAGYTPNERIKSGTEPGFFANVLEHIKRNEDSKEKLLGGDLFSRMGSYWDIKKHEIKSGKSLSPEKKLEDDLVKKLGELKMLEQKWQVQKLALEEDLKFIHEREREIQTQIKELKLISNELSLFRHVNPEQYFHMRNGVVLKCLHDLIDILEVIDNETFDYHVNNNKNDFSEWVRHIFRDNKIADKMKNAKTKLEMIETLENISLMNEETEKNNKYAFTNTKKYFWLSNGDVVRNIYELYDALRIMSDELFSSHVGENKNDFAKWIKEVFKNDYLSEKLSKAKTKKEMIDILEVFL
ncbi:MAG: hypothetical protein AABX32_04545 [Nanoarchaeota archaeon]